MKTMKTGPVILVAVMIALVGVNGCGDGGGDRAAGDGDDAVATFRDITPAEAQAMIEQNRDNPDFVLLDIRTRDEFAAGHLEGADQLDFYAPSFKNDLAGLDTNGTYLIYCRTARRTGIAMGVMRELGFTRVYNMLGGITRWQAEGLPVAGQTRNSL